MMVRLLRFYFALLVVCVMLLQPPVTSTFAGVTSSVSETGVRVRNSENIGQERRRDNTPRVTVVSLWRATNEKRPTPVSVGGQKNTRIPTLQRLSTMPASPQGATVVVQTPSAPPQSLAKSKATQIPPAVVNAKKAVDAGSVVFSEMGSWTWVVPAGVNDPEAVEIEPKRQRAEPT